MSYNIDFHYPELRAASVLFCKNDPNAAFKKLEVCDLTEEQTKKIQEMISKAGLSSTPEANQMRVENIKDRLFEIIATHMCFSEPFSSHSPGTPSLFYSDKPFEFRGRVYPNLISCIYAQMYTDQPALMDCCSQLDDPQKLENFSELNPITKKPDWWNPKDKYYVGWAVLKSILEAQLEQNPHLKKALIDTSNLFLVCDGPGAGLSNGWDGTGSNMLGKCLMELRHEYKCAEKGETTVGSFFAVFRGTDNASYRAMLYGRNERAQLLLHSFNKDIWQNILAQCTATTLDALFCTNKDLSDWGPQCISRVPIETLIRNYGPGFRVIWTGKEDFPWLEQHLDKLALVRGCHTMMPMAENHTLIIMIEEEKLSLKEVFEIAKQGRIFINSKWKSHLLNETYIPSTNRRSILLMTSSVVVGTRNQPIDVQVKLLEAKKCNVMGIFKLITMAVFTRLDFGEFAWEDRTTYTCSSDQMPHSFRRLAIGNLRHSVASSVKLDINSISNPAPHLGVCAIRELTKH